MNTTAATRLAANRVIYSLPGPSVRASRNRRRNRRLFAVLFVLITLISLYIAGHAEAAPTLPPAPRCAAELSVMRRACARSRWIGEFAPRSCETARASHNLCLARK